MSDFDKEAEREKLRQQYESEKEERKSTQRMSELLLQGATMTGKHCDTCGDPIFRMNGNEFCPTCQGAGTNAEAAEADASSTEQSGDEAVTGTETEAAGEATEIPVESGDESGTDARAETAGAARARSGEARSRQTGEPARVQRPNPPQRVPRQSRRTPPSQTEDANRSERAQQPETRAIKEGGQGGRTGDLSVARESLVRKLTTLAQEAEETNDVGHSRELLAATREAAEALAALDRANR
ncbi:Sjogren's syndrome/scleroderma autoantigen 1 family protein [Haladaptatus sp. CMAA 1911]|uniref:Sjogren's syndrome/scleroderma autoantigen 1 family protein n=1 Tax=unclassified Haladaptatus TaxID=2622732 RepID=UPI0037547CD0